MTMGLKPYSGYKDSGEPWLGIIPTHWEKLKLRRILNRKKELRNQPNLPLLSVVREHGVILRDIKNKEDNHNSIPEDLRNYKVVQIGQFVVNKMKAWQGSYGISRNNGIVSPAYFIFDVDGVVGDFFHRAIRSKVYIPFFAKASDGIRIDQWDLSQERMKEIPFIFPSPDEQQAIVRFLDHVDRRVRRYIRARQKLIKLLEEQKQAVIHQAVTRGLDPNVRLRPSGVEWLENIPEHWSIVPLKFLGTKFGSGMTPRGGRTIYQKNGIPFIRSQNVHFEGLNLDNIVYISPDIHSKMSGTHIKIGDVLLNITGASIGRVCVVPNDINEANVNQHVAIIRTKKDFLLPEFLSAFLSSHSLQLEISRRANGAAREGLPINEFINLPIPLPSIDEQKMIIEFLNYSTENQDELISNSRSIIKLLKEFNTTLIADVVTGKMDVREAAARLPEETEEEEAFEVELAEEENGETEEEDGEIETETQ